MQRSVSPRSQLNVRRLADIHVKRYLHRIDLWERKDGHVNIDECRVYLKLWQSIAAKGWEWDSLTVDEQREVQEAIEAGE